MSPPMARTPPADFYVGQLGGCAGFDKPKINIKQRYVCVLGSFWQKITDSSMGDLFVFVFKTKLSYAEIAKLF